MKSFLREPLLHFLVVGTLLFVLYGYWGGKSENDKAQITVGSGQIERLKEAWKKQWRRAPTDQELRNLIEKHIEEEVLYREALAMGLEKDDTIVRRRLAQKMRFLIQDIADQGRPSAEQLKAFFEADRDQYRSPALVTFTHVYFSPDRRGPVVLTDAQAERDKLNSENVERAVDRGDPFMLHHDYRQISRLEAARLFGREFADELFEIKPGRWHGPIRSGYGIHLVRIQDSIPARMPDLVEIEDRLRQDYMNSQRRKINEAAVNELKARYKIVIDKESMNQQNRQALVPAQVETNR